MAGSNELADFNHLTNVRGEEFRFVVADADHFSEGVSFLNVRHFILASVPQSYRLFVQQCGRAVRVGSHRHLPPEEQTVQVDLFVSVLPRSKSQDVLALERLCDEAASVGPALQSLRAGGIPMCEQASEAVEAGHDGNLPDLADMKAVTGMQPQLGDSLAPHLPSPQCGGERFAPASIVEPPQSVSKAISLRGAVICEAILMGRKDIENRHCKLSGWIALHVSQGRVDPDMQKMLRRCIPDLPAEISLLAGHIVGLALFEHCIDVQTLRAECACNDACDMSVGGEHLASCSLSPFAHGPLCNIISAAIRLSTPVFCRGAVNQWTLPVEAQKAVADQLKAPWSFTYQLFRNGQEPLPRRRPLPWLQACPESRKRPMEQQSDCCRACGSKETTNKKTTGLPMWLESCCNKCFQKKPKKTNTNKTDGE